MKNLKVFFVFYFLFPLGLFSQPTEEQVTPSDAEKEEISIPITEVTEQAKEALLVLNKIRSRLKPSEELRSVEEKLPILLDSLKVLASDSIYKNLDLLTTRRLRDLRQEWALYLIKLNDWGTQLDRRSRSVEQELETLESMASIWQATDATAKSSEIPGFITERIHLVKITIDTAMTHGKDRINGLLTLQDQISKKQIEVTQLITLLNNKEAELRGRLFVRDSPALLQALQADTDTLHFAEQLQQSWTGALRANRAFIEANEDRFYLHVVIFIILLGLMIYLNHRNKRDQLFDEDDQVLKASASFISRPFSASLLIALVLTIWIYPERTAMVGDVVVLFLLIPVLRLVPGIITPVLHKPIYVLAGLYVLDFFQKIAASFVLLQRLLLLLSAISAMILFIWLIRSASPIHRMQLKPWPKLLFRLIPVILVALVISVIANFIGSVSLAFVISSGIIESLTVAVALYTFILVLDGLIALLIRRRSAKVFHTVKTYAQQIEKRAVFLIHLIAFFVWIRVTLRVFSLFNPIESWFYEVLAHSWTFGSVTISVQGIVDFLLIIIITFILVRIIRVFLDLEVFSRLRLPRGIPGAISMVVRYTLVGLGIFLAISSIGIDLGTFGLLAGALGVGLGFGLQNVIANFVSGIILAFERPVQVGDMVEIGTVFGHVKEIGVRSSTVKTFDGSEVIVPNADLISNQVTNWTLSDNQRRLTLPVKVAIDSDPHQVLDLLLEIVRTHPGVLKSPEPIATFNGFGDYFLDFTLYYWITENYFQVKTEVAMGVYDRIKQAGIDVPKPRREIFVKGLDQNRTKEIRSKK